MDEIADYLLTAPAPATGRAAPPAASVPAPAPVPDPQPGAALADVPEARDLLGLLLLRLEDDATRRALARLLASR